MKFELDDIDTYQIIRALEFLRSTAEKQKVRGEKRGFRPPPGSRDINGERLAGTNRALQNLKTQMRNQQRKGQ